MPLHGYVHVSAGYLQRSGVSDIPGVLGTDGVYKQPDISLGNGTRVLYKRNVHILNC